jgi:raffinose/stachyose/melibiose transport system permease protein
MNRYTWRTATLEAVMIAAALVFLFPVYVLVMLALKSSGDQSSTLAPPDKPTLHNFTEAWQQGSLGHALVASLIVTTAVIFFTVLFSSSAAYPLSRFAARWSKLAYFGFLAGLLLPAQLALRVMRNSP